MDLSVAILTREFPPEVYGGAGVHVGQLAAALSAHVQVAVHCFGGKRDSPLVAAGYRPWEALDGDAPHLSALRAMSVDLAMTVGVDGADLVHSHTWYTNLAGHLAKLLYSVPHVATVHSLEPLRPWKAEQLGGGYALSCLCERTGLEAADGIIAVSWRMRNDVLACYPVVDPDRVVVIHNGVDPDIYRPDPAIDVLERYGIDADRPLVVFVGRITRQKGLTYLLQAAVDLDPEAQLVLCAGASDTEAVAAEVGQRVASLRTRRGGVVWIERMLEPREVAQILSHATVFVCPSVYEPFGLVNLEAMACGAAVVATATGGIPEVVVDGETGLLVPLEASTEQKVPSVPLEPSTEQQLPSDPAGFSRDLADRINQLLTDPERARRMGEAGRRRVLERFTWREVAGRTAELYRRMV